MDTSGINAGYLNYLNHSLQRDRAQLDNDMLRFRIAETQRAQAARPMAGRVLMDIMSGGGGPQFPTPPQPGQASVPAPQGPALQAPASGQPAPQVQPWRTFDDHVAQARQAAVLPDAPASAAMPQPPQRRLDLGSIIKTMKQNNVSDDMTLAVLDDLAPFMNAENRAEMDALRSQLNIARETDRLSIAQMRNDLGNRELERKQTRDEWQKGSARDRAGYLREKIAAENRRTDMFIQMNTARLKNQSARQSMDRLKALNLQLGRAQQLIPGLENMVVNGTSEVREQAASRLEAINRDVDALQQQMDAETRAFLGYAEQGDQPDARPAGTGTGYGAKPKPTAADRAWVKKHPQDAAKFKAHFGVEP